MLKGELLLGGAYSNSIFESNSDFIEVYKSKKLEFDLKVKALFMILAMSEYEGPPSVKLMAPSISDLQSVPTPGNVMSYGNVLTMGTISKPRNFMSSLVHCLL